MSKNLVLTFFLILLLFLWTFSFKVNAQDDYFNRNFEWEYGGSTWTWSLSIPKDLYEAYKSVPVFDRVKDGPGDYGFLTTTNDYYLELVAEEFQETVDLEDYGSFDEVSFVLAFVQSLDYTSDSVTFGYDEYPRFPIETLVDNGGDCEDTSILFATLTLIMGYGTVYLNPPEHYAVGILGDELSGYYWTYNNQTYYYCETTGEDWKIGDLPEEYHDVEAYIYPIREWEQYVPTYTYIPPPTPTPPPGEDKIEVYVTEVVDGDTFNTFQGYTVRLADIDAPEYGEIGFSESTTYLENLIENRTVYIDIDDVSRTDPFDRFVCLVFLEWNSTHDLNVNQALLTESHAVIYDFSNNEFDPYSWSLFVLRSPIPTPTPSPTITPTPTPTITPSPTPTPTPSPTPTPTPTPSPTPEPSPEGTFTLSIEGIIGIAAIAIVIIAVVGFKLLRK